MSDAYTLIVQENKRAKAFKYPSVYNDIYVDYGDRVEKYKLLETYNKDYKDSSEMLVEDANGKKKYILVPHSRMILEGDVKDGIQ